MIRRLVLGGESLEDGGILSALWPRGLAGRFWLSLQKLQILPTIPFNTLDWSDSFYFGPIYIRFIFVLYFLYLHVLDIQMMSCFL